MIVLARGSITRPDAFAPYIDDEMRVVGELKADGVVKAFVIEGLMTLDYEEIY